MEFKNHNDLYNEFYYKLKEYPELYKLFTEYHRLKYYAYREERKLYQKKYNHANKESIKNDYYPKYKEKNKQKYYCDVCEINCVYKKAYDTHINCIRHSANIFKLLPFHTCST